ncbi:MAG TPA: tryptophan 2,3-dioxygenase family protein, partial [Pirellulaceae bacterium]
RMEYKADRLREPMDRKELPTMQLTYASYLHLNQLLALQTPRSQPPEHDEALFIIVHQTYELWFKLLLHELEKVCGDFDRGDLFAAIHTWKRCRTVMKTLVAQIDIVETMTPMSFASFRDRLDTASGFQSIQFREVEFLLGYKRQELLKYAPEQDPRRAQLEARLFAPSVNDFFRRFLTRHGVSIPEALPPQPLQEPTCGNEDLQAAILRLYRERPELGILFELMTDFDEGLQEWRYRHVKLVERTIGNKRGTGGSLGVEFLKRTLFHPVFPDLWEIRHQI